MNTFVPLKSSGLNHFTGQLSTLHKNYSRITLNHAFSVNAQTWKGQGTELSLESAKIK